MLLAVTGTAVEVELQQMLTTAHVAKWMQDIVHMNWWILCSLSVLFTVLWWKLLNKARLPEVLLYTVLTLIIMMGLDECGDELTLWVYPVYLFPVFPVLSASNLLFVTFSLSLTYQYFPTWKSFGIALIGVAGFLSFILEPAFAEIDLYRLLNWSYGYNFLLYIVVALLVRGIVLFLFSVAEKHSK